jgi:hypothetical protein
MGGPARTPRRRMTVEAGNNNLWESTKARASAGYAHETNTDAWTEKRKKDRTRASSSL